MADLLQARYTNHLRAQAKTAAAATGEKFACPFCEGRIFQQDDQLFDHVNLDHPSKVADSGASPQGGIGLFRKMIRDEALRKAKSLVDPSAREASHASSDATAGGGSTPDLTRLTLDGKKSTSRKDQTLSTYRSGRKRAAGSDIQPTELTARASIRQDNPRRAKVVGYDVAADPYSDELEYSRDNPRNNGPGPPRLKSSHSRLFDPYHGSSAGANQAMQLASNPPSEGWHVEANPHGNYYSTHRRPSKTHRPPSYGSPKHSLAGGSPSPFNVIGQPTRPGGIEIQRFDPRYPNLLLQPDSRPISQEQLASEVKSIYAGLTMVETKCIHVDRAQASAAPETEGDPNSKLANDHWQALIALHRTLLHEHHDFFLASQHPSASPALRRLASKYSMPARMWKHGIHSFLELLRRRLPESLDYMLAFIYLAYQMMALLYETVPTFEDTWIECLGDLGRYRMAIEDEDLRDRETWAGVARFWYSKAADKSPSVGRLYHHLAILARPNALQQLYYYSRSLTCVQPFMSARESILTLLDPILGRSRTPYAHSLPVDTHYIRAHGMNFGKLSSDGFEEALTSFLSQLDNQVGRVTAKWKDQGVYIAVTNIAGLFDYGSQESILRHVFQLCAEKSLRSCHTKRPSTPSDDDSSRSSSPVSPEPKHFSDEELSAQLLKLSSDFAFSRACRLTFSTLALILRRIGDKNVLPHVHVLFAFLSTAVSISYVGNVLCDIAPWLEIVAFLNTLSKSERFESPVSSDVFPNQDQNDSRPLPEDYLIRGQVWSQCYFPEWWFDGEHDEEERTLELASTIKSRTERILRLGHQIASYERWIHYDRTSNTWSVSSAFTQVRPGHRTNEEGSQASNHTLLSVDAMDIDSSSTVPPQKFDDVYDINDDSPEMRDLEAERISLSGQLQLVPETRSPNDTTTWSSHAPISTKVANSMLLRNYTVMVCDTNLLLTQREVFQMLLKEGDWSVVIPDGVISELLILSRNEDSTSIAAQGALSSVRAAIMEEKKVRIATTAGSDVTHRFVAKQMGEHMIEGEKGSDEVIIGVARRESDLNREARGNRTGDHPGAKPAVLVTEDRAMRLKAATVGVAAIATSMIKKVLIAPRRRSDPEDRPGP